jgi:hypothetical protein
MNSLSTLCLITAFSITVLFDLSALADSKPKKYNTSIYEAEQTKSHTAKVKTFKNSRGDTLVYFEEIKKSGPYVLSESIKDYATLKNRIAKSAATGGPKVSVTIDDNDNILSVMILESDDSKPGQ